MTSVATQFLLLHMHDGNVWYLDNRALPRCTKLDEASFMEHPVLRDTQEVRLMGVSKNVPLCLRLYDLKQRGKLQSLKVASPLAAATQQERNEPHSALFRLAYFERAPSVGGFHEFEKHDYLAYALSNEMVRNHRNDQKLSSRAYTMLKAHPAWPALTFVPGLCWPAVAAVLSYILDPRWYIDTASPNDEAKLRLWMGLHPKTQAGVTLIGRAPWRHHERCRVMRACWYDKAYLERLKQTFAVAPIKPVANSSVCGLVPAEFLGRVWATRMGLDGEREPDPVVADLRTSERLLSYLRLNWLAAIYRNSPALPDRQATLFRPKDFFRHPAEVESYERFRVQHDLP